MGILDKAIIKHNFLTTVENASFISDQALDCLNPVLVAYFCDSYPLEYKEISASLNMLSLYLNQLHTLKREIKNTKDQHPEIFKSKKFSNLYNSAIENIMKVYAEINYLRTQIAADSNAKNNTKLTKSIAALEKLENQIQENQKTI